MSCAARNVLLVAGRLARWSESWRMRALLARLAQRDLQVSVLCVANDGILDAGPDLVECPALGNRWHRRWALRRLRFEAEKRPPGLLHVLQAEMTWVGLALAGRWQIPYLQTVDEFLPHGARLPVNRRWCRGFVVPSQELADDLILHFGVSESLVFMVPPTVPLVLEARNPEAGRAQVPVIGAAGPFVEGSGLATFLRAARGVVDAGADAEFVIAGRGPRETELRRGAERLRIADRVTFTDDLAADATLWRILDIFCLTSRMPTVGRPLAVAMAHGIPVIASDIAGLRSLVADDSTGLRVPAGDAEGLARTIMALLDNPQHARALAQRGQQWVGTAFNADQEQRLLAELYQSMVAPSERAMDLAVKA
jgi:glycosyltransferase involved in cell wall biosynthesis